MIKKIIKHLYLLKKFPLSKIHYGASMDSKSSIGKYVVLFRGVFLQNAHIDDYSYVQTNSMIINTNISKFCSIASHVNIGLSEHHTDMVSTSPLFYDNTQPLPFFFEKKNNNIYQVITHISSDTWVGYGAFIKSGVTIGIGAVIGAGAVVTKDVEPYSIVGGVPAKHIRYRFEKETREKLLASQWWTFDEEKLTKLAPFFEKPEIFLEKLKEFDAI